MKATELQVGTTYRLRGRGREQVVVLEVGGWRVARGLRGRHTRDGSARGVAIARCGTGVHQPRWYPDVVLPQQIEGTAAEVDARRAAAAERARQATADAVLARNALAARVGAVEGALAAYAERSGMGTVYVRLGVEHTSPDALLALERLLGVEVPA